MHKKDSPNAHSGGKYAESTIHHIIKDDSGNYSIQKSFYKDSLTIADYLTI